LEPLREGLEQRGVLFTHRNAPFLHYLRDTVVEGEQSLAIDLRGADVGRHVDAARFHDHGIDQRIDALHVERAGVSGLEFVGQRSVAVCAIDRDRGKPTVMVASSAKIT